MTFRQTDAEGVDREMIMVMAHFVELLGQPVTRQMAETAVEEAAIVHILPVEDEELPF